MWQCHVNSFVRGRNCNFGPRGQGPYPLPQVLRLPHSVPSSAALVFPEPRRRAPPPALLASPRARASWTRAPHPPPASRPSRFALTNLNPTTARSSSSPCPDRRWLRRVAADPGVVVGGAKAHPRGDGAGVPGHGGSCCSAAWLACSHRRWRLWFLPVKWNAYGICLFVFIMWFQTADIDEKSIRRENPDDLVMVLAEAKVGTKFPALFRPPFGETMLFVVLCCSFRPLVLQTREFYSYIQLPMWCFVWLNCKCVSGCCKFLL